MILLFKPNGKARRLVYPDEMSLTEMRASVGGHLELVKHPEADHIDLLVNEDGRSLNLPENQAFPRLYGPVLMLTEGDRLK